jgi:hypothetical protein
MKTIAIKLSTGPDGKLEPQPAEVLQSIEKALDAVNGKASSFTITSALKVADIAAEAELYLRDYNVAMSERGGADVTYRPAGPSANSYGYNSVSTRITLRRKSLSGDPVWLLTNVERVAVYPRQGRLFAVTISDRAAAHLVKRTLSAFGRSVQTVQQQVAA